MASRSIVTLELDDQTWSWIREQAQRWRISPETALAVVVEQQFSAENRDQPRRWPDLNDRQAAASDESAGKGHQVAPDPEAWDTAERLHPYSQRLAAQALERAMMQLRMVHGVLVGEIRPFEERPADDEPPAEREQGQEE